MTTDVRTEVSGNIWKVLVEVGDTVAEGQVLFIMEVMKMEVSHCAPASGTITAVHVTEGQEGVDGDVVAVTIA